MSKTVGKLLIVAGDGIGPEAMGEVKKIASFLDSELGLHFEIEEDLVGGAAIDAHGVPLHDDTMALAHKADAVMLGAVGGPKWDDLDFSIKPERGLLRLRKELELFANLRPAICFDALADSSSLKHEVVAGLDIMIVRELTGGIYFGERAALKIWLMVSAGALTPRFTPRAKFSAWPVSPLILQANVMAASHPAKKPM